MEMRIKATLTTAKTWRGFVKKIIVLPILACVFLLCGMTGPAHALTPGDVLFCKGVTDSWEPVDPGTEFDSNVISCLFLGKEPFGVMQAVLSIYMEEEKGQVLLHRETCDVNPEWDALYIGDIPLPAVGKYVFAMSSTSGETLSSGAVVIKEKTVEEPIAEKNTVEGTSLEGLFNKFKAQTN